MLPTLQHELNAIPFVSLAVVNLVYNNVQIPLRPTVGVLSPAHESSMATGLIFDHWSFPSRNQPTYQIITVILGSQTYRETFGDIRSASPQHLAILAREVVDKQLGIRQSPVVSDTAILDRCMPQYVVGHHERLSRIQKILGTEYPGIAVTGASYQGVGVPDCIHHAYTLANRIANGIHATGLEDVVE